MFKVNTYGNAGLGVLLWSEEEGAVNERISVVDLHGILADDAKCLGHFRCGQIRQNETANVIITVAALVFHLFIIKIGSIKRQLQFTNYSQ